LASKPRRSERNQGTSASRQDCSSFQAAPRGVLGLGDRLPPACRLGVCAVIQRRAIRRRADRRRTCRRLVEHHRLRDLDDDQVREHLRPWLRAIEVVCDREPAAAAMARMAILLRACGRTDESLALCERAGSLERVMLTEVVRTGTWRRLGDRQKTAAAFRRALQLDPINWSLYLDLADLAAEDGDPHRRRPGKSRVGTRAARRHAQSRRRRLPCLRHGLGRRPGPSTGASSGACPRGVPQRSDRTRVGQQILPPDRVAAARRLQTET
jgi:hypothetical protein